MPASGLCFNVSKCCFFRFTHKTSSLPTIVYHLDGHHLPFSDHCRDLGIIFSSNLSWSKHYILVSTRAYCQLGLICRTFSSSSSVQVKKMLYLALVRSQITHCSQLWRPHHIKDIKALEKIQQQATKFILNYFSTNYRSRLTCISWFTSFNVL